MAGATRNLPFPLPVRAARCAAARIAGACPHRAEVGAAAKDEARLFLLLIQEKNRCPLGPRAARTQLCRAPSRSVTACFCREFAGKHVPVERGILRLNPPGSMYSAPGRLQMFSICSITPVRQGAARKNVCPRPGIDCAGLRRPVDFNSVHPRSPPAARIGKGTASAQVPASRAVMRWRWLQR